MKCVNIVLVGIGGYGGTFVGELLNSKNSSVFLQGLVDPHPERCAYIEEIKKKNIPIYSCMEDFYAAKSADLAVISTPIFLHAKQMITAMQNGSDVLCEKPLCSDEADIEKLEEVKKKTGKRIFIGYQWSYSDAIKSLKADILANKYGKLIEMKTLILRPRNKAYFGRGVGWAGKINMPDGTLVYDSVANNSAAHYLFNMLHLMGKEAAAAAPENIRAELLRANDIENFDISKIDFTMGDAKACFIAAHPVEKTMGPIFEYRFEKGTVYYSASELDRSCNLFPKEYFEYGNIVSIMNDGTKTIYGNPMNNPCKKLYEAVEIILENNKNEGPCGLKAAAMHTRLINFIQKEYDIHNVRKEFLKEENELIYVEGLFEEAVSCYKNISKSLMKFA